jgi:hypothetical protein
MVHAGRDIVERFGAGVVATPKPLLNKIRTFIKRKKKKKK